MYNLSPSLLPLHISLCLFIGLWVSHRFMGFISISNLFNAAFPPFFFPAKKKILAQIFLLSITRKICAKCAKINGFFLARFLATSSSAASSRPKKSNAGKRSRNWCFTSFQPILDVDQLLSQLVADNYIQWYIVNPEVSPSTSRPHCQGYFVASNPRRFAELHRREGMTAWHLEPRRGNHVAARQYCMKGEHCDSYHGESCHDCRYSAYRTFGREPANSAGRVPFSARGELARRLLAGQSIREVVRSDVSTSFSCLRQLKEFRAFMSPQRDPQGPPTEFWILYGDAGVGKSRFVFDHHPVEDVYVHVGGDWWDGYDGHPVVVIEEFYGGIKPELMNRLADRYPLSLPYKGGFVPFTAKIVYLTTNKRPYDFWHIEHDWRPAFFRRVTNLIRVTRDGRWFACSDIAGYARGEVSWSPLQARPRVLSSPFRLEYVFTGEPSVVEDMATVPGFVAGTPAARPL